MRSFILFVFICLVCGTTASNFLKNGFKNITRNEMYEVLKIINKSSADPRIPDITTPLNDFFKWLCDELNSMPQPVTVDSFQLVLPDNPFIAGVLRIEDLILDIKKLNVTLEATGSLVPLKFLASVNFDRLILDTNFKNKFKLADYNEYFPNDGSIKILLNNFKFELTTGLKLIPSLGVKNTKVELEIGEDVNFQFTGLLNDEELSQELSRLLNSNLYLVVTVYKEEVQNAIASLIENIINTIVAAILPAS